MKDMGTEIIGRVLPGTTKNLSNNALVLMCDNFTPVEERALLKDNILIIICLIERLV